MSDSVQQIKDRLNIIDVVSPYVELHKAGKHFKGRSPFASEKTPSFYVSPDRGMYYCFSTTQGGDMFTFIQTMEGVDFKEALKLLAQKAGVELVPEDPKKKGERERLYAVLKDAAEFYAKKLHTHSDAREYLANRSVSAETIAEWQIGYAPGPPQFGWREGKEYLESKEYTKSELLKAGLIKPASSGKDEFDVFRDRVMFPMRDSNGRVVAFSGRLLTPNDKAPKYVNSPETELYKKSELLFGYDKAKQGIRQFDFSLIVEGQFDVVMSHQAGYTNTVAVSGTALTLQHVQLLERLSQRVVLALDADRAGIAAIKRGAELMLGRGLDVKVAEVPEGKDPADLVQMGKEYLKKVVGTSVHVIEFLLHVLKRSEDDPRTLKLKARDEVLPFILLLPNRIDQEHFVDIVAKEIGSSTDAIRFELNRLREEKPNTTLTAPDTREDRLRPQSNDAVLKTYTFILSAKDLVEEKYQELLHKKLKNITDLVDVLPEPDPVVVAEAVFVLERQFEKISKQAVLEELISGLNQLQTAIVRREIGGLKAKMIDQSSDDQLVIMKELAEWERLLKSEPILLEEFMGKKD